jgi:ribosomal protein L16/L10AE
MRFDRKYPQYFKKNHKKRSNKSLNSVTMQNSSSQQDQWLGIYSTSWVILPHRFIAFFRKIFRKWIKKRKIRLWFNITLNKTITNKAKNSRMGKGVGTLNRFAFNCNPHKPIIMCQNISPIRIKCIASTLQSRVPVHLKVKKIG